jgi:ribosomal protein S17E
MSDDSLTQSQADLLNQMTGMLQKNNEIINTINQNLSTQTTVLTNIKDSLDSIVDNTGKFNVELEKSISYVEQLKGFNIDVLSEKILESVKKEIKEEAQSIDLSFSSMTVNLKRNSERREGFLKRFKTISSLNDVINNDEADILSSLKEQADESVKNAKNLSNNSKSILECLKKVYEASKNAIRSISNFGAALFRGAANVLSYAKNLLGGALSVLTNMLKAVTSLPFAIARLGANIGEQVRKELVEGLGQSFEDLKEKFDMNSFIGENIRSMKEMSEKSILEFRKPNSELVKFFGYGTEGLKKYLTSFGETVEQLGYFGEVFAGEIRKGEQDFLLYTKLKSAAGYSAEDFKYFAMDAYTTVSSLGARMSSAYEASKKVSEMYNINTKMLSRNFMILRKDIVNFGHISDVSLNETAAIMTKMGVKMEDAAAVFNKFSTFESASNAAAILGQTFGMNLNAMDMIKAENPAEIFTMFRTAMLDTGKTFDQMSRFEKSIMVQQTGMSAESLKAMMNYSAAGLTFEEARKRIEESSPEAQQLQKLKELRSSIKEIKKTLNNKSFFSAFTDGLITKLSYHDETRETVMALSQGYQGLYEYAINMDPKVISDLVRPIRYIIDTMRTIFESEGFRKGIDVLLKGFGKLMESSFDITDTEKAYQAIRTRIRKIDLGNLSPEDITLLYELDNLDTIGLPRSNTNVKPSEALIQRAKSEGKTVERFLLGLIEKHEERSKDILFNVENSNRAQNASQDLTNTAQEMIKENKGNVSSLMNITSKIVKALIVGAITGITALVKTMNSVIEKSDTSALSSVSFFSLLTGISEDEAKKLFDGLTTALANTFKNIDKIGSIATTITGSILGFFYDLATEFAGMIVIAIKSLLGQDLKLSDFKSYQMMKMYNESKGPITNTASSSILEGQEPNKKHTANVIESQKKRTRQGLHGTIVSYDTKTRESQYAKTSIRNASTFVEEGEGNATFPQIMEAFRTIDQALAQEDSKLNINAEKLSLLKTMFENTVRDRDQDHYRHLSVRDVNELIDEALDARKRITARDIAENSSPKPVQDMSKLFNLSSLYAKDAYKFIDSKGKEISLSEKAGMLGRSSGVVSSILNEKKKMTAHVEEIHDMICDLYNQNNFKEQPKSSAIKQKVMELNKKLSEAKNNPVSSDINITPVFSKDDIDTLIAALIDGKIVESLCDPSKNQGRQYFDIELTKNTAGNIASNSISQNYKLG